MFTWEANINRTDYTGGKYETLDEAEDRFCAFMGRGAYDRYSQTRHNNDGEIFGSIMDKSMCVGGYSIYKI